MFNSWYDFKKNKAVHIEKLIEIFNKNGNLNISTNEEEPPKKFSSKEWKKFSWAEKQEILLKYRLAYISEIDVNWCPKLGTVLANDEVVDGLSERGGHEIIKKKMTQWSLRISAYSDRLLEGLDKIDWPEPLKEMQRNWIGKSEGSIVNFDIVGHDFQIKTFTTRPDTIFGASFIALSIDHPIAKNFEAPRLTSVLVSSVISLEIRKVSAQASKYHQFVKWLKLQTLAAADLIPSLCSGL